MVKQDTSERMHQSVDDALSNDWVDKYETVLRMLPEDLSGKTVLEVGCAEGLFSMLCAARGANVIAVDLNSNFLDRGKQTYLRMRKEGIITKGSVNYVNSSVEEFLMKEKNKVDIVMALDILEHTDTPLTILRSLSKASKQMIVQLPNGLFFSHVMSEPSIKAGHIWFFTPKSAHMFVEEAGGSVLESNSPISPHIIIKAKSTNGVPVLHEYKESTLHNMISFVKLLMAYPFQIVKFFLYNSRKSKKCYMDIIRSIKKK